MTTITNPVRVDTALPMRLGANPDRLDSWKEIASYLKREVRTVQLWEKREGMPVHRHFHNRLATVFAFRSEIEAWSRQAVRRGDAIPPAARTSHLQSAKSTTAFTPQIILDGGTRNGAREAYLKGRYFQGRRSESGLRTAIDWFRLAIQRDAESALAYSGLADSLTLLSFYEIAPPAETIPEARYAALRAIDLDANLAEARTSLADIHLHFDRDWSRADQQYRCAIQCNPGYALGYHWYANLLTARGQHEAARRAILHALDIDPVSVITQVWAGVTSHLARRYDEAITHYKNALELDPNFLCAHMYMAQTLEHLGQYDAALNGFKRAIDLAGGSNCITAMMAHTYAAAGDHDAAHKILRKLGGSPKLKCVPSYDIAAAHAALGDPSQCIEWLQRACRERHMRLYALNHDPRFDALRSHAEFLRVAGQIGLGQ